MFHQLIPFAVVRVALSLLLLSTVQATKSSSAWGFPRCQWLSVANGLAGKPLSAAHRRAIMEVRGGQLQSPASLEDLDIILKESAENGKLVVIDFYSANCPPCEKVAPLYHELSESEEFSGKAVFLKVNVDDHPAITHKYGVTGWPTFLFIKNGEVQTEIVGGKLAEATLYDWVKLFTLKGESK